MGLELSLSADGTSLVGSGLHGCKLPRWIRPPPQMQATPSDLESEVKEAFVFDVFVLAFKFYTQAILLILTWCAAQDATADFEDMGHNRTVGAMMSDHNTHQGTYRPLYWELELDDQPRLVNLIVGSTDRNDWRSGSRCITSVSHEAEVPLQRGGHEARAASGQGERRAADKLDRWQDETNSPDVFTSSCSSLFAAHFSPWNEMQDWIMEQWRRTSTSITGSPSLSCPRHALHATVIQGERLLPVVVTFVS